MRRGTRFSNFSFFLKPENKRETNFYAPLQCHIFFKQQTCNLCPDSFQSYVLYEHYETGLFSPRSLSKTFKP